MAPRMAAFSSILTALTLLAGIEAAFAQQDLTAPTTSGEQGETIDIPITYDGDGSAVALQLDLLFDPAVLSSGAPAGGGAAADHLLRNNLVAPGDLRFVLYSPSNAALDDGVVTTVPFTIPADAELGITDLTLASVVLGDADALPIVPSLTQGSIEILEHFLKVVGINTVAATPDGLLAPGEATTTSITQLSALFTDPVRDPAGDTDTDDVTNPANYLLVGTGADGVLATADCLTGVDPGDTAIVIGQVLYDDPSLTSVLAINGGVPLPRGAYRLLVCGSTSIVDLDGKALDGDLDGVEGGDYIQDFHVLVTNLLLNPNFDADLSSWTLENPEPVEIAHDSEDADGAPTSGSAVITYATGQEPLASLSQCVPVDGEGVYQTGGRVRIASDVATDPMAVVEIGFFLTPDCADEPITPDPQAGVLGDTAGAWSDELIGTITAPETAVSARVSFTLDAGASTSFEAKLDNLFFYRIDIFVDGFELGDTSGWSTAPP